MRQLAVLALITAALALAQEPGAEYLIITHDDFYSDALQLARWKRQKGLTTKVVKTSEIGSDSLQERIRAYAADAYATWTIKPEYLVLMGSKYQIPFPHFNYQGNISSSDNYYADVSGDFHVEMLPGRLWIWTPAQAQTVVAKIIGYEKNDHLTDSLWFQSGTTIVNEDDYPPYSDSTYWADAQYALQLMRDAGFCRIESLSQYLGHNHEDFHNSINEGRCLFMYRGTGSYFWEYPFLDIDTTMMTNGWNLPVVISGTCNAIEGIGHDWLVAGSPSQPRGTVGYYATTTSLMGAAEFRSALCRGTLENLFCDSASTLGKAAEAGRLNYVTVFGNTLEYNGWGLLGDPEMTMWTMPPRPIEVTGTDLVHTGLCTLTVRVMLEGMPFSGARVCACADHDTAFFNVAQSGENGYSVFVDSLSLPGDTVHITVTGRNLQTVSQERIVVAGDQPFLLLNGYAFTDSAGGNGNLEVNPGEDLELEIGVKNAGLLPAESVYAFLQLPGPDTFATLRDTVKFLGDIAALDSAVTGSDGFNVVIDSACPDMQNIGLRVVLRDVSGVSRMYDFELTNHAAELHYDHYWIDDTLKYLVPGNPGSLVVWLENRGTAAADSISARLFTTDSFVTVTDSLAGFGSAGAGDTVDNAADPFLITASNSIPGAYHAELRLAVHSGVACDTFSFEIYIGQQDYLVWDPDPNHTSGPSIHEQLAGLGYAGEYTTDHESGVFHVFKSMFVCLGMYGAKKVIYYTDPVVFEILNYLARGGKMYLEGGDVWFNDPPLGGYDFAADFCVSPIANNSGYFQGVAGVDSTFAAGMMMRYVGENSSVDRINAAAPGLQVLCNSFNGYGAGVAANHRTVGTSFELGCLVDTIPPSTRATLLDSIMSYFGIAPSHAVHEQSGLAGVLGIDRLEIFPNPAPGIVHLRGPVRDARAAVKVLVYDVSGRQVFEGETDGRSDGIYNYTWRGRDQTGRNVGAGIYFIAVVQEGVSELRKVVLVR